MDLVRRVLSFPTESGLMIRLKTILQFSNDRAIIPPVSAASDKITRVSQRDPKPAGLGQNLPILQSNSPAPFIAGIFHEGI
jgi:hypothetical protein